MEPGDRVKARRGELGLSQRKLGERCGISGSAIAQWESGQTKLSSESLMLVAKALETTPEWIMSGESKQSTAAADRKFVQMVNENLSFLDEEERADIEALIEGARKRKEILDKYK